MKQTVQQHKRKAPTPALQKPRNTTHLRPGIVNQSNHSRLANDKWERQADDAATRIMRGECVEARRLTPAPVATKNVPGSRAEALPNNVKFELEKEFGADLSAVHIHRDSAAASAAQSEKSRAFVSGNHIYFSEGQFQPESVNGRFLLLHEIAHVLQQSGRPSSDGRIRASQAAGSGNIQCFELDSKAYVEGNGINFSYLEEVYDVALDPVFSSYAEKIKNTLIPKGKTEPDFLARESAVALEKFVKKNGYPEENFLPFLYDCLKFTGNGDRAFNLIIKNPGVKTRFWMQNMGSFAHAVFWADWPSFQKIYKEHSGLKSLWHLLIDTFRQMVFAPYRGIQAVDVKGVGTIKEVMETFEEAGKYLNYEADNELFWGVSQVMFFIDNERLDQVKKWAKGLDRYDRANTGRILMLAHGIRQWAEELSKSEYAGAASIGATVLEIANQAVQYWQQVLMLGKNITFRSLAEAPEGKVRLSLHKHFIEDLPIKVLSALKIFFKLGKNGTFPNIATYVSQRDLAKKILMGFSSSVLQMELLDIARQEDPDDNLALSYGFFMKWIESVVYILDGYIESEDARYEDEYGVNDIRFAHRRRTAFFLNGWLSTFSEGGLYATNEVVEKKNKWPEVEKFLQPVVDFENQGKSQVALVSDWELDPGAEIKDLAEDFKEGIIELDPLNIRQISKLYIALYYSQLNENIDSLLQDERKENLSDPFGALKRDPILKRALDATSRPRRWIIKDREIALTPEDKEWVRTFDGEYDPVMDAINTHPKTVRFIEQEEKRTPPHYVLLPADFFASKENPVFIWSLPPLDKVVELLRNSNQKESLNTLITKGSGLTATDVQGLSWQDWLTQLSNYMSAAGKDDITAAVSELDLATQGLHDEKEREVRKTLRDLSTHERRLLSLRIIEVMSRYDRHESSTHEIPDIVLNALNNFGYFVNPPEDRFVQMAALVLSIATALNEGLGAKKESFLLFLKSNKGPSNVTTCLTDTLVI